MLLQQANLLKISSHITRKKVLGWLVLYLSYQTGLWQGLHVEEYFEQMIIKMRKRYTRLWHEKSQNPVNKKLPQLVMHAKSSVNSQHTSQYAYSKPFIAL